MPVRAAPVGALAKLQEIVEKDLEIQEALTAVELLYKRRAELYIEAQEEGATIREIATAAGTTMSAVKQILGKVKR